MRSDRVISSVGREGCGWRNALKRLFKDGYLSNTLPAGNLRRKEASFRIGVSISLSALKLKRKTHGMSMKLNSWQKSPFDVLLMKYPHVNNVCGLFNLY